MVIITNETNHRVETQPEIIYITKQEQELLYLTMKKYKTNDAGKAIGKLMEEKLFE